MRIGRFLSLAGLAAGLFTQVAAAQGPHGVVFTMGNETAGNRLLAFRRTASGALTPWGSLPTGGQGTGTGLGSQGSLTMSENGRFLYAANAGSNDISVFYISPFGPALIQVIDSGGDRPISIAANDDFVYVLNNGGGNGSEDSITGFRVGRWGGLTPIAGSTQPLSGAAVGPAQVGITNDGRALVVTEKGTNKIDVFPVDRQGRAGAAHVHASSGQTPFGFSFNARGFLITSEAFGGAANASVVSSYRVLPNGNLITIDGSVPTHQTAACWVVSTGDGRFSYSANTGSGTVSGFAVNRQSGDLTELTPSGQTGITGPGTAPADSAIVGNRFLYVLDGGASAISAFSIGQNGALTSLGTVSGLTPHPVGLVAW
jgi:6-phosphogluconolactonase